MTNCSRGIHNAWHFYYALVLVFKVVCHPLTRRWTKGALDG
nr:DUF3265 domain-containing protein [Vibrio furnissii]